MNEDLFENLEPLEKPAKRPSPTDEELAADAILMQQQYWDKIPKPLRQPSREEVEKIFKTWAGIKGLHAAGLLVRQYGRKRLSELDEEAQRWIYFHMTEDLANEM